MRKLCGVTKRVGKNESWTEDSESTVEVPLTVEELSSECFSTGHIGIHLNPSRAQGLEPAFGDLGLDAIKQQRVKLFNPLVLLSLCAGESVLGIPFHQVDLSRPRPSALLLGDFDRPEPSRIDMTVTDTPKCTFSILSPILTALDNVLLPIFAKDRFRDLSTFRDAFQASRLERVHDFVGGVEGFVGQGRVPRQSFGDLLQGTKVPHQSPGFHIRNDEVRAFQAEIPIRIRRIGVVDPEHSVAAALDVESERRGLPHRFGDDEFDSSIVFKSASDTLQGETIGGEDHRFRRVVKFELNAFVILPRAGDLEDDLEPMVGPTRTKLHALLGFFTLAIEVSDGLFERRLGPSGSAPVCQLYVGWMRLRVYSMRVQERRKVLRGEVTSEELIESVLMDETG